MMIKKILFLVVFSVACSFFGTAQNTESDKIQQLKIAFFTEELNLTASEAKRFWPVYTKHNKKYEELRSKEWSTIKSRLDNIKNLSENASDELLKDYMKYKKTRVEYREVFVEDLKKVISPKQIMMLKKAEYDFHKKLLNQYQSDKSSKN
jgi:Flp pilus assembly CpaF family ATPase